MKSLIILSFLFLSSMAQADLVGDYDLLTGPSNCPTGSIQILEIDKETKERVVAFGSKHSWMLKSKDISETKEEADNGCTYTLKYEKSENKFVSKTTRSKCPSKKEEGLVTEEIKLEGNKLSYEFSFREIKLKCSYSKVSSK